LILVVLTFCVAAVVSQSECPSIASSNDYCLITQGLADKIAGLLNGRRPCKFAARLADISNDVYYYDSYAGVVGAVVSFPKLIILATPEKELIGSSVEYVFQELTNNGTEAWEAARKFYWRATHGGGWVYVPAAETTVVIYVSAIFKDYDGNQYVASASYYQGNCCVCDEITFPNTYNEFWEHAEEHHEDAGPDTQVNFYFADILAGSS